MRVDLDADVGSVRVRKAAIDFVEPLRLVVEEFSLLLPAHKVLQRLEHGEIDFEFAGLELRVDFRVQYIAEAAGDRDCHTGIAPGKILRRSLPGRRGAARVEDYAAFGLRLLIERVKTLGARRHCAEDERREGRSGVRESAAEPCGYVFFHEHSSDKFRNRVSG